jgi:hypothetical protein
MLICSMSGQRAVVDALRELQKRGTVDAAAEEQSARAEHEPRLRGKLQGSRSFRRSLTQAGTAPDEGEARQVLERWRRLHIIRTAAGFAALSSRLGSSALGLSYEQARVPASTAAGAGGIASFAPITGLTSFADRRARSARNARPCGGRGGGGVARVGGAVGGPVGGGGGGGAGIVRGLVGGGGVA